ncbi:pleckstrin-like [Corticium candelabrum]|uniref:pleckstrin-like n=1 Tax=Corticium candelabrum TaxID=121492 RepID=UPI002E26DBC4|nr:pleckstrin-like [Corticium candelabrum]
MQTLSPRVVLKEGFLVKKGHVRHNWRTRWFVLCPDVLTYYRQKNDATPAGEINLGGCALVCPVPDYTKRPNVIRLTTVNGTEFLLQAPDTETRDSWAEVIGDTIRQLEQDKTIANPMVAECDICSTPRPLLDAHNSELIAAMQDPDAGVPLGEHKNRLKTYKDCFAGCELIEWLLSWSFVTLREEGCQLANSLLNEAYLQPVGGLSKESFKKHSHSKKLAFVDGVAALYRFSALTPSKPVEQCFSTLSRDADLTSSETDSSSECGRHSVALQQPMGQSGGKIGKITRQGFLMKKGHRRHNWKARKFVLHKGASGLLYYRGSKEEEPLGSILLEGCTVEEVEQKEGLPALSKSRRDHLFIIRTATGVVYLLQASTREEMQSWIAAIRVAS